ncbi:MAG: YidC/Oxa1 family membrane protein insertase [Chloroflexota bacterium]|nr:YidC/Oxa1 family membrane protein insertase [Chloroflexota bacterium]
MLNKRAIGLLLVLGILVLLMSGCAPVEQPDGTLKPPTWIAPIAAPLQWVIEFVYNSILTPIGLASYGLAIILVTVLIRMALYPLTRKQMSSMKKMQEIQPRMKEIQDKYGKDREKLAQKQMELYKEEGVNPAGGCLPMLVQMPILFAFYYALLSLGDKLAEPFLWIPDLSFPEYREGMTWLSPVTIEHIFSPAVLPYLVLPIVYILSQFVMQRMSTAANPSSQMAGGTGNIMKLMPLMFGYITLIVPSGLTLYWVTSNVVQIIQQGFTTGWSSLWPGKKEEPALAAASGSSKQTVPVTSDGSTTDTQSTVSAGRRRKLRKKKR